MKKGFEPWNNFYF